MKKCAVIKNPTQRWLWLIIFEILLLALSSIILYDNRSKNKKNTEWATGILENIEIYDPPRGLNQIYVTIDGQTFVLFWIHSPRTYHEALMDIELGQKVSVLIVNDHNFLHFKKECEIVDFRSDAAVYYSVDYHNANARVVRILTLTIFIFLGLFGGFCGYILFVKNDIQRMMRRRKKRKRKALIKD